MELKPGVHVHGVTDEQIIELRGWHQHIELIISQDGLSRGAALLQAYREGPGGRENRLTAKRLH